MVVDTLRRVLKLVPAASSALLPLLLRRLPHKRMDATTHCLFLEAAFSLAESQEGRPIREEMLLGVVDVLLQVRTCGWRARRRSGGGGFLGTCVCVCVCVWERERERKRVRVCLCEASERRGGGVLLWVAAPPRPHEREPPLGVVVSTAPMPHASLAWHLSGCTAVSTNPGSMSTLSARACPQHEQPRRADRGLGRVWVRELGCWFRGCSLNQVMGNSVPIAFSGGKPRLGR